MGHIQAIINGSLWCEETPEKAYYALHEGGSHCHQGKLRNEAKQHYQCKIRAPATAALQRDSRIETAAARQWQCVSYGHHAHFCNREKGSRRTSRAPASAATFVALRALPQEVAAALQALIENAVSLRFSVVGNNNSSNSLLVSQCC